MKKFLLHTCCAPCSIAVIDELKDQYDLTVFFYNPNIFPEEEYGKRKAEVIRVCEDWGVEMVDLDIVENTPQPSSRGESMEDVHSGIFPLMGTKGVLVNYDQEKWNITVKGLENEPEGGARCTLCFKMRLEKTAQYAKENNFDIFSTSLTSGRTKRAEVINPIGQFLADKYGLEYMAEDWKKGGRQEKGRKMVEERGIYRQNYCGCKYSLPKE